MKKGRQKTKRNINDDKAQAKSTNIVIVLQAKICRINSLISLFSSVEQSIWQLSGVVYPPRQRLDVVSVHLVNIITAASPSMGNLALFA